MTPIVYELDIFVATGKNAKSSDKFKKKLY